MTIRPTVDSIVKRFNDFLGANPRESRLQMDYVIAFVPGILFIALALTLLLAPELVLGVVAGIFFSFGILACFGAWKIIQMKRRVEKMAQQLRGKVVFQSMSMQPDLFGSEEEEITKKTIFH